MSDTTILDRLDSFLDRDSPQLATFLQSTWSYQQSAITYHELKDAILTGELSMDYMLQWQQDYSHFVVQHYAPIAQSVIETAARHLSMEYGGMLKDPYIGAMDNFINQRGAKLVREISTDQFRAINTLVKQASLSATMTVDELAHAIRPCIGLTRRQAQATHNYYQRMRAQYYQGYIDAGKTPKQAATLASGQARQRQATYAAKMHRQRAATIAQTEMAFAYNAAAEEVIRHNVDAGIVSPDVKKRWLTAEDERVCKECGALEGEMVDMDTAFSNGAQRPPAHPLCRCAIAYDLSRPEPASA